MLSRLLELLRSGGTYRLADLARELDTTPALVEAMMEDLARMGYVRRLDARCEGACRECPVAGLCAAGTPSRSPDSGEGRAWVLTEKGERSTL